MADNEKLIFQIGFDLDSAVKDATSEWKRVQRELEAAINARPISISMDTRGLERFNTFVERTYASLEDLQDLFPEVFKETKDGEGITKRFQAMETSINAVSKEMRNLEKVWNNLSQAEKFDDDGNLTERAQDLKRAYVELYQSQKTQGQTLQEITKEAINLANQEYEAQQRKKKQEEDFIRLLNLEETTLEKLQAKQGAWKQKLSQTEIGSSDWSNAIAEVQRLETKMKDLQKQIKGVATETKKTSKTKVDIDTSTFVGKLKDLENRWKALNAEQRKGAEGQALRTEWRKLSEEAGRYTSTLRSAVSAEDRLANAKKKTTQATHEQNTAYKTQSTYLARLFQRMVAYASVTQAFSFIRNIREVTAQFELQRVALGSIIGDLNEANAMFEQIKAAAVKSPFQIKELVTYTKQLAAYNIETDELFETTQRLADISAGLGVGMERLVLAYGQIRATGYLRASEVRQLTEAGIPIVEELAKKMSDLRGETVSAAEVMGLISERAISFGMVKEVFDDMTSAGGMFYKMQEKQAETLQGQWNNLKDSIAIMYEEIGNTEGVNNSIKGTIGLVKSLAENWQLLGNILKITAYQYGAMYAVSLFIPRLVQSTKLLRMAEEAHAKAKKMSNVATQRGSAIMAFSAKQTRIYAYWMRQAANAHTMFGRGVKRLAAMFLGGGWIGAVIGVLTVAASWFISARKEAKRLNEELDKIGTEGALQADQSVRNFERLAKAIRESADGSAKQTEALEEMKRAYGEFLPSQDKSIINLVREKDGYNAITQAIREKIALQIQEQKLNTIASEYGSRFDKWEGKIATDEMFKRFSKEEISLIVADIKNAVNEGLISTANEAEDNAKKIQEIIKNITGKEVRYDAVLARLQGGLFGYGRALGKLIETQENYNTQIQDVENSMESATGSLGKYTQAYKDFKEELKDVTGTGEKFSFEWNESKTKAEIKAYNEFIGNLLAKEGIKLDVGEAIDFKGLYEALGDNYPQLKQVVAKIQGEYEKLVPKDLEKLIKEQFSTLATKYGASLDKLQHYFKSADQSTQDWVKTLKDAKTELGNQIFDAKKLDKDTTALEAQKQVIEEMITAWDNSEKTQKAGAKSAEQALKDELSAIEKIYKRYQDLRKLKSETDTQSILAKEFKGVSLTTLSKAYSPKQMIEVYQKALAEAQRLGKKDLVLEIQTKIGEFNVAEEQRELEKSLKDLSDKLSRTKTAKEFFDRMLGLTGDKQLSATLTMSVYGEGGEDLGTKLAQQTAESFRKKYKDIDFSAEAVSDKGVFNWDKILAEGEKQKKKFGTSEYDKFLKDVDEGRKASGKRLETLMNELEKTKTYSEKLVDIYTNTQERLNAIDQEVEDEPTRNRLKEQVKALQTKEMQKLQYESFKDSPMYVAMFENLDATSTAMLTSMRNHIVKLRDAWKEGLDPTQLKELQSRINEIDKQLATRNPFKGIVDGIKEMNALGNRKQDEQSLLDATTEKLKAERAYQEAVKSGKPSEEIERLAKELGDCVKAEDEAARKMSEWDDATQKVMQGMQSLGQVTQLVQTTTTAVNDIVEAFGSWGDAADEEFWNTILDGVNGLMSGVQSAGTGVAQIMTGDILGGVTSLVSGIGSIASAIGDWIYADRIRQAEKEIERQQELLDNLEYSYERLQKAQEKAFGSDYISNYEQRLANLQAQQEAYLAQADAERSKGKKADEDKIKEYEEQARDTADAIKDMQSELSEHFLGTDLTSAARDFANAWIDAYKEFGSTADAMKDKFKDMIENMIVESFAAKVIQTALQPIFDSIDNLTKDGVLDVSDATKIAEMTDVAVGNIDVGMTNLMNALSQAGISVRGMGSNLTGISRDIATASEESILGLAAGINTQNFYISQVPTKLDTIIGLLRGDGAMPQGSALTLQDVMIAQNQFLSHLPTIAQHTAETVAECKQIVVETRRTADALERVIKPRGTQSTYTMNTTLGS